MPIRSIFLFAPAESTDVRSGPARCAIELAKRHQAQLTVFCVALDVTTPGLSTDAQAVAVSIKSAADAAGVAAHMVTEHSHATGVHDVIREFARLHDISVTGSSRVSLLSERIVAEHLMFESGRPVLLVPPTCVDAVNWDRAAIAWDNSAAAARALGDAVTLLDIREALFLAIAGDKPFGIAIEPEMLVTVTTRRGLVAELASAERGDRSIATALQDEAGGRGANLLVMGAFGHSRLRRFVLGSATADILERLKMPVLMSH